MTYIGRYNYAELRAEAMETGSQEALENLARWCDMYGNCWNGECYDIDDGYSLYPVFGEPDEDGDAEIIGYEIR